MINIDGLHGLYPSADYRRDIILQDDGDGPYIKEWNLPGDPPTDAETEAAALDGRKLIKLEMLRAEAASRILAKWPAWAQNNCALGIYPEATAAQCTADIAAVVTASNTAEDAVMAATSVAEVEAVTATWPVI